MNTLRQALEEYLSLRRSLGFKLSEAGKGLHDFVTYMEQHRASYITQVGSTTGKRSAVSLVTTLEFCTWICAVSQRERLAHTSTTAGSITLSTQASATLPVLGR